MARSAMPPTISSFPCRWQACVGRGHGVADPGVVVASPGTPSSAVRSFTPYGQHVHAVELGGIASALATPAGVSIRICTIVARSSTGFMVAAGTGRRPNCGTVASWERWPRGAKRHARLHRPRPGSAVSIRAR